MKVKTIIALVVDFSTMAANAVEPIDPAVRPQGTEQVDIYLLLGQSNMKGVGALPAEQSTDPRIIHRNMGNQCRPVGLAREAAVYCVRGCT